MVDAMIFGMGKMKCFGHVANCRPGLHEDDWFAGNFCISHFFDVFEVVFADADDFGERFDGVGLVKHNYDYID